MASTNSRAVPGRCLVIGLRVQVEGLGFGVWCLVYVVWCLVLGVWCVASGAWSRVGLCCLALNTQYWGSEFGCRVENLG